MAAYLGNTTINNFYLGSTNLSALYVGSNQIWPTTPIIPTDGFIVKGYTGSLVQLESKLIGETLANWIVASGNTYATSSTNYTISASAFGDSTGGGTQDLSITAFLDYGGFCSSIQVSAFTECYALTEAYFPNATTIGVVAFANCYNLATASLPSITGIPIATFSSTSITNGYFPSASFVDDYAFQDCFFLTNLYLPNCTSWGTFSVFSNVGSNGTITVKSGQETNPEVANLAANYGWTIITV